MNKINSFIKITMFMSLFSINNSMLYGNTKQSIIKYKNGDIYKGETRVKKLFGLFFSKEIPNGEGELIHMYGSSQKGNFKDGELDGEGEEIWKDSIHYKGNFTNGMWHGWGRLVYPNNDTFTGNFSYRKLTGYGNFTLVNGNSWSGYFKDGKRTGLVKIALSNGTVLEDDFSDKEFYSIIGDEYDKDLWESSDYNGGVKDGLWHGKGKIILPSGATSYEGKFGGGKRDGWGKITSPYGCYESDFSDRDFYRTIFSYDKVFNWEKDIYNFDSSIKEL